MVKELRDSGIAVDVNFKAKGVSKGLKYASVYNIPYVILIGENELKKDKVMLKNLTSGEEKLVTVKQVVKKLRS